MFEEEKDIGFDEHDFDIYTDSGIIEHIEEDEISAVEEGFMQGYLAGM
ncbi:hypothetical protein JXA85_00560 [Candidatus Woesearchaeota archaeon]|nr:hypothetical protein [Candidatus Woesearchaeota archaeon]